MQAAPSIQKLLDELERLPGVGPKSAQRMAYWILNTDAAEALRLADAIREVKAGVHFCARCFNYAEGDLCEICASSKRDGAVICVVSEPRDIPPIERTAVFNGVYHVLGGVLAPMEGVGPGDLRIAELMGASWSRGCDRGGARHEPQHRRGDHGCLISRGSSSPWA